MKIHEASAHEKIKPFECEICGYSCSQKSRPIIFYQFMRKGNNSNVRFVKTVLLVQSVHEKKKPRK